jgi:signal peptidase II
MTLVGGAALLVILAYTVKLPPEEKVAKIGLAMITGGAIGNLIDRATAGYVVDFVDVYWLDYHFWAFNVADSAITLGVFTIIFELLRQDSHVSKTS